MTIKQHGGIFGRKPTFSKVDVEGSDASSFDRTGSLGKIVTFNDDGSEVGAIGTNGNVWFQGPSGTAGVEFANGAILPWRDGARASGAIAFGSSSYKFNGGHFSDNLVMDSGKGIDFSATSGTGTSELFDDYEEGNCTLTLKGSTTDPITPATTTGSYTKIGNLVHVSARWQGVDVTGAVGNISIDGLPYASTVYSAGSLYGSRASSSDIVIGTSPSSSSLNVYDAGGNLVTWSSTGNVYWLIGISYKV